ncbi:ROK family protein [Glaciibacter flavus]|uniref:ROK family protein n=1 Tax=Orlajensenia flava TaxID=2565934 RepID=A0A4S4FU11_9MICO|nr:ROK family protein [Glaciibacter flavus]THG34300.1 ROK family protein [Glaciibacter flavus]
MTEITAGPPALLRSLNARAVLEVVDRQGPIGRPELRDATGLSKTAIAQTLTELERRGAVERAGFDVSRRGPVATLYGLRERASVGAAVDIGHHRVRVIITGLGRQPLARASADADHSSAPETAALVHRLLAQACSDADVDLDDLQVCVIGVPAVVGEGGELRLASGLAAGGVGLASALADALPCPASLENDTNLAAIAEQVGGSARGLSSFVLLSVGASVGAGVVIDGELRRGSTGAAGEIAYLPGPGDEIDDSLGAQSVTTDAEAEGMAPPPSARAVFDAARAGDAAALRAVERTARRIARVSASLALVLDPELIILGGSIGSNGDLLVEPVSRILRDAFPQAAARVAAATAGEHAVLDGAVRLCGDRLREVVFDRATAPLR